MRLCLTLSIGLLLPSGLCAAQPPVQVCLGDSYEWAPYTYWERVDGAVDRERLTGYSATRVLNALSQLGLTYRVRYMPWPRAQQEMAEFAEKGRCELTWDASYNAARAGFAYYSVPLYRVRLGLIYSRKRFARAPSLQMPQQLRDYKVCGVIGFNYQPYGIDWPIERLPTMQQNLDMLDRQRCDFFPSEIEPLFGGIALGTFTAPGSLESLDLPQQKTFYLMVSKGSPRASELVNSINQVLIEQQESGEATQLQQRYLPQGN
jgi:polar amino acid transport system substrate-binding protein